MDDKIAPDLTEADEIVLNNLLRDIRLNSSDNSESSPSSDSFQQYDDQNTVDKLAALKSEPVVFCTWDYKNLPSSNLLGVALVHYIKWARTVARNPVDVIFVTHILLYLSTSVPSAVWLFWNFTWTHGVLHLAMQLYYTGSFTLMLHNCIHQNGILSPEWRLLDKAWPYILEPLMGHTWDSYYYHHVKHHHVENNGPDDLSSTIRYQRDSLLHFSMYVGRFLAFIWLELPYHFWKRGKTGLAVKTFASEMVSYAFMILMSKLNFHASLFVLIIPFCIMRVGLMVGNFGQHALVDEIDPKSDFRSSITLIDVPSNRYCFNDGYHTSHHLNPLRHWRDHPAAFMKTKDEYLKGRALFFRNIDYLGLTYHVLRKDYLYLADCMIPVGDQIALTRDERAELLRSKTRRFTEEEIQEKFYSKKSRSRHNLQTKD